MVVDRGLGFVMIGGVVEYAGKRVIDVIHDDYI